MEMIYDYNNIRKTYGLYNKISHIVEKGFDTSEEARNTFKKYDSNIYEIVGLVRYERKPKFVWN